MGRSPQLPMAGIPDRNYNAACGRLASHLGISQAAARRKVELRAAQEGSRDSAAREALAQRMLEEAIAAGTDHGTLFSDQLGAVGNDVNFMLED
jgi:hypothetical protein